MKRVSFDWSLIDFEPVLLYAWEEKSAYRNMRYYVTSVSRNNGGGLTVSSNLTDAERDRLLQAAKGAARRAYAPYSGFRMGAAVLTESGAIFAGCNVENTSYGLTICAERAAVFAAVCEEGGEDLRIRAVAIVNENSIDSPPCGACRQVMFEFGPEAIVIFQGSTDLEEVKVSELLPKGFSLPSAKGRGVGGNIE